MKHVAAKKSPKRKKAAEAEPATPVETPAAQSPQAAVVAEVVAEVVAPVAAQAPASVVVDASRSEIALASNCTVKDAVVLKKTLVAVKDVAQTVIINASAVERVDTATLQLLCSFVRERVGNDREVTWREPSASIIQASKLLGLTELLCLSNAEAAA
jgi:ABC-type transporter Mla MlaB component